MLKAIKKADVATKWDATPWAKKLAARSKRTSLNDFERFQVKVNKQKVRCRALSPAAQPLIDPPIDGCVVSREERNRSIYNSQYSHSDFSDCSGHGSCGPSSASSRRVLKPSIKPSHKKVRRLR